ncbi:hypothetical protein IQ07DRAFT_580289 [Pyrenochaeta sp. DS3sAY3a]|nr:hypothetical protein IQ07DRAFT_580289 [Pyrenochaeta sp. DS3sAY3a]
MPAASAQAKQTGSSSLQQLRDRANIVCTACHARKVKCDLQSKAASKCTNCHRLNQACIRRDGVRKRRRTSGTAHLDSSSTRAQGGNTPLNSGNAGSSSQATLFVNRRSSLDQRGGYISSSTVLSYAPAYEPAYQPARVPPSVLPLDATTAILDLTQAHILPRPPMLEALQDSFFQFMWPFYHVVDRNDASGPGSSILLQQAICLAGASMRQDPSTMEFVRSQYGKIKTLIHLNYETDHLALLKTLCLLVCYSPLPSNQITLDGPWHWIGVAIRLAYQLGLHRQSTYDREEDPGCLRRIFWFLVNSDRLAACCWGRPLTLQPQDHDVQNISISDFAEASRVSRVFQQTIALSETTGAIANINESTLRLTSESAANITSLLCSWLRELPEDLRLFDSFGVKQPFYRPAWELHINYFVNIILLQMLDSRGTRSSVAAPSFKAALGAARLYEELHCRDETCHLVHAHGFFCMVVAVPLICFPRQSVHDGFIRNDLLQVICAILEERRHRYGGWDLVLQKIKWLREDVAKRGDELSREQTSGVLDSPRWASCSIQARQQELFAFPTEFHDYTTNLENTLYRDQHMGDMVPYQEAVPPGIFDEDNFNIFDVFNLDFSFPPEVPLC